MASQTYIVKAGDTLSGIGKTFGLSYADSLKNITGYKSGDSNKINVGEKLTVNLPGGDSSSPAQSTNTPAAVPGPNQGVTDYLNGFQSSIADALDPVKLRQSVENLTSSLVTEPAPQNYSRVQLRQQLNQANGIEDLSNTINDLKTQQEELAAKLRAQKVNEQGKPVALGVISGRITEEQQQAQDQMDFITRQLNSATNQLNTKLQVIQTTMGDYEGDYQSAVTAYNNSYNQHFQMVQFVYGMAKDKIDYAFKAREDARANLEYMQTTFANSGTTWDQIPDTQKSLINQLEVQSGFPVGFFQKTLSPLGKVISTTSREDGNGNQYADILYTDSTGKMTVKSQYIGKVKVAQGTSQSDKLAAAQAKIIESFNKDLKNPSINVARNAEQEQQFKDSGTSYMTREQYFRQLLNDYPNLSSDAIKREFERYYAQPGEDYKIT